MTSGLNLNFHQNDSNLIVQTDRPASPGRASGGGAPSFFASLAVRAAAFFRGIWDCVRSCFRASSPMPRAQGLDGLPGPGSVTGLEMLAFGKCFAELDPGLRSDTEAVRRLAKGLQQLAKSLIRSP